MLITIALLWIAIKLQAPLWVYACVIGQFVLTVLNTILNIINNTLEKKNKELKADLVKKMSVLGFESSEAEEILNNIGKGDK